MSQRQGKEAYLTPTKELLQPSLSPGAVHSHGKRWVSVSVINGFKMFKTYFQHINQTLNLDYILVSKMENSEKGNLLKKSVKNIVLKHFRQSCWKN